jgi:hypothetical protein
MATNQQLHETATSILEKCNELLTAFPSDSYDVIKEIKEDAEWLVEVTKENK